MKERRSKFRNYHLRGQDSCWFASDSSVEFPGLYRWSLRVLSLVSVNGLEKVRIGNMELEIRTKFLFEHPSIPLVLISLKRQQDAPLRYDLDIHLSMQPRNQ